jgi:hypothetical protein
MPYFYTLNKIMKINFNQWIFLVLLFMLNIGKSSGQGGFMKIYPEGYRYSNIAFLTQHDQYLFAVLEYDLVKASFAIVQLDTLGTILNKLEYTDIEYNFIQPYFAQLSDDGHFYIVAKTHSSFILLKFDLTGQLIHRTKYPFIQNGYIRNLIVKNNEIFLIGEIDNELGEKKNQYWVQKLDQDLNVAWEYTIKKEYTIDPYEYTIYGLTVDDDKNVNVFAVANMGYRGAHLLDQYNYRYFYKLSTDGKLLKMITIQDPSWAYGGGRQTSNGKIVVVNHVHTDKQISDISLKIFNENFSNTQNVKIDVKKNSSWDPTVKYVIDLEYDRSLDQFGLLGTLTLHDFSPRLEVDANFVTKLNRDFSKKWEVKDTILFHPTNTATYKKAYLSPSGSIYLYGYFNLHLNFQYSSCAFIRKYDTNGCLSPTCNNIYTATDDVDPQTTIHEASIEVFPNPATQTSLDVRINDPNDYSFLVRLVNLQGQQLHESNIKSNTPYKIDISDLPSGIYLLHAVGSTTSQSLPTKKIIIHHEK